MILTADTLKLIMPKAPADIWAPALMAAMAEWKINTPLRAAAFLAQIAHESSELTHLEESLNYSAERLMAVWPSRMTLDPRKPARGAPVDGPVSERRRHGAPGRFVGPGRP